MNFDDGYMIESRPDLFKYVDDTIPKLSWYFPKIFENFLIKLFERQEFKDFDVPWNYHLHGMKRKMLKTANLLDEEYLPKGNNELIYYSIWNGSDTSSYKWHNDLIEGANVFFLMYYTNMNLNEGGEIMFRNLNQDKRITCFHLPKKYDVLYGSQAKHFEHRVETLREPNVERITMNFGFKIDNSPWE